MTRPDYRLPSGGTDDEDRLLLERLAARDTGALETLYDRHAGCVFALILRILGQRSEAEEVLQEVFISAWTRANTYDPELGTPLGWLVGIARNRAVDRLRSNAVRTRVLEEPPPRPGAADPEREAFRSERQQAVARALDRLPAEQRHLIEQAFFLGWTQSELAERHKLPLGTVKGRIRTGMQALRQHLSEFYVEL